MSEHFLVKGLVKAALSSTRTFPMPGLDGLVAAPLECRHLSRELKAAAATTAREKEKRQPKYIGNLLKQAKLREVENDRVFERKLQKEREAQDKVRETERSLQ